MKSTTAFYLLVGWLLTAPGYVLADTIDGKEDLLCAIRMTQTCLPNGECTSGTAEDSGLPTFIEVEFKKNQISDTTDKKGERKTKIQQKEISDDEIILQGSENFAWTLVISRETGKATMGAIRAGEGVVLFGACTTT